MTKDDLRERLKLAIENSGTSVAPKQMTLILNAVMAELTTVTAEQRDEALPFDPLRVPAKFRTRAHNVGSSDEGYGG